MAHGVNFTEQLLESSMIQAKLMWVGVEAKGPRLKGKSKILKLATQPRRRFADMFFDGIILILTYAVQGEHTKKLRLQSTENQAKKAFAMSKGKFTYPSLATRSSLFCTFGAQHFWSATMVIARTLRFEARGKVALQWRFIQHQPRH
ncbi:hypothetical protein Tco_0332427 [Tanacetum coccineum]